MTPWHDEDEEKLSDFTLLIVSVACGVVVFFAVAFGIYRLFT